jgi:hypothetical protein
MLQEKERNKPTCGAETPGDSEALPWKPTSKVVGEEKISK